MLGNSARSWWYGCSMSMLLTVGSLQYDIGAFTNKFVTLSMSRSPAMSTNKRWCLRKSAPMIGLLTAAITNFQRYGLRSLRSSSSVFSPYVEIVVLLAAYRQKLVGVAFIPAFLGMTEMFAPVSIRNDRREFLSVINRRCESVLAPVAASANAGFSFPRSSLGLQNCMDVCTVGLVFRTFDDSNRSYHFETMNHCGWSGI